MTTIIASAALLAFERAASGERLLCVFNMSDAALDFAPPAGVRWQIVESVGDATLAQLGGFAAYVAQAF